MDNLIRSRLFSRSFSDSAWFRLDEVDNDETDRNNPDFFFTRLCSISRNDRLLRIKIQ